MTTRTKGAKRVQRKRPRGRRRRWGTIIDPAKGRKDYQVRWPDPSKKSGYAYKRGFPNKDLADRFLSQKREELVARANGLLTVQPISSVTFQAFVDEVLELKSVEWAESTLEHAKYSLNVAATYFGQTMLDTIGVPEAQRYAVHLDRQRKNKSSTIGRAVSLLSGVWERAVELGYTKSNPWPMVRSRIQKSDPKEIPYVSPTKLEELYEAVPETRTLPGRRVVSGYRPLAVILGETGVRIGEALGLRWRDVAEDYSEFTVQRSKSYRARTIPLTPRAAAVLREICNGASREERVFGYLAVNRETAGVAIGRYMRKAGHAGISAHTFRHAFATGLMESGNPITWVMELLGHSRIQTTLRYARWAPKTSGKIAIRRLAKLRGQVQEGEGDDEEET